MADLDNKSIRRMITMARRALQPLLLRIRRYSFVLDDNILDYLRKKSRNLTMERDRLQKAVEYAQKQKEEVGEHVLNWLTKADELLKEVQYLENDRNKTPVNCSPYWGQRHQLGKKVEKSIYSILELQETGDLLRLGLINKKLFLSSDFLPSISLLRAGNRIAEFLSGDSMNIFVLYGKSRVGKTTLVKAVITQGKNYKFVEEDVMIAVSQPLNIKDIQGQIADSLGLKLEETSEKDRARKLWSELKQKQKIILVLDDVLEEPSWKEIGIPYGKDHMGCKILVLTQTPHESFILNKRHILQPLNVFTADEACDLFRKRAGLREDTCPKIKEVANKIAKKCQGLPMVIITLGSALRGKSKNEWENALKMLQNSKEVDPVYRCLKLSFELLQSNETRQCFLLCSLFPQYSGIEAEDLVRYAFCRRLFQDALSIEATRTIISAEIEKLKASLLLLNFDGERKVKMPKMIHDAALLIASKQENSFLSEFGLKEWPRNEALEPCSAVSLLDAKIKNLPDQGLKSEKLKILLLGGEGSIEISSAFLEGLNALQVFSLHNWLLSSDALQHVIHLRALDLKGCKLGDISSLGMLKKLEILSFCSSNIIELPKEVGQLNNLRLLDLSDCQQLRKIHPDLIQKLSKLEELYLCGLGSFKDWELEETSEERSNASLSEPNSLSNWAILSLEELYLGGLGSFEDWELGKTSEERSNASLSELNSLSNLAILSLEVRSAHVPKDFVFPALQGYQIGVNGDGKSNYYYPTSRTLKISASSLNAFQTLFQNVQYLHLSSITGYQNLMPILDQGGLNELASLELERCQDMECIIDTTIQQDSAVAFPKLEKLVIEETISLKELCKGPPSKGTFPKLQMLTVKKCPNMISAVLMVESLKEVILEDCSKLAMVFQINEHEENHLFSNLTHLELTELPELKCIWSGPSQNVTLPALKVLAVKHCCGLTSILTTSIAQSLEQLEKLQIDGCSRLEQIITKMEDGTHLNRCLPQLTTLEVIDCSLLEYIFPMEGDSFELRELQQLALKGLTNLNSFCQGMVFISLPSLIKLKVEECPLLIPFTIPVKSQIKELRLSKLENNKLRGNLSVSEFEERSPNSEAIIVGNLEVIFLLQGGYFLSSLKSLILEDLYELSFLWGKMELKDCFQIVNLQSLTCLQLIGCKKLTRIFTPKVALNLPQLSCIKIQGCDNLIHIIGPEIPLSSSKAHTKFIHFPNLIQISVEKCSKLESLLPVALASLPKLKTLEVKEASGLKQIFELEGEPYRNGKEGEPYKNGKKQMVLPKLKVLMLEDLPNLISFIPVGYSFIFLSLDSLRVINCEKMVTSFTHHVRRDFYGSEKWVLAETEESLLPKEHILSRTMTVQKIEPDAEKRLVWHDGEQN